MDRRAVERAFARAHGTGLAQQQPVPPDLAERDVNGSSTAPSAAAEPPVEQPETAVDTIKRVLKAWHDKEYFQLLQLPQPVADELGVPTWPCSATDVSKAYRRLSVLVHPDKNPGEDARAAFEALNETHRMLKDPGRLEQVLKDVTGRALMERDRRDALAAAESGHAAMAAQRNQAMQRLRKQQGAVFGQEILAQVKARQAEAARKAAAVARARVTGLHKEDEEEGEHQGKGDDGREGQGLGKRAATGSPDAGGSGSEDEEDAAARRRAMATRAANVRGRKKPTIMH